MISRQDKTRQDKTRQGKPAKDGTQEAREARHTMRVWLQRIRRMYCECEADE
jgi:ribosomal protein L19E